jgi:hypothetical protein
MGDEDKYAPENFGPIGSGMTERERLCAAFQREDELQIEVDRLRKALEKAQLNIAHLLAQGFDSERIRVANAAYAEIDRALNRAPTQQQVAPDG